MPYDERLDQRIRTIVNRWQHIAHKKMFGGICYLQQGNMMAIYFLTIPQIFH